MLWDKGDARESSISTNCSSRRTSASSFSWQFCHCGEHAVERAATHALVVGIPMGNGRMGLTVVHGLVLVRGVGLRPYPAPLARSFLSPAPSPRVVREFCVQRQGRGANASSYLVFSGFFFPT